MPWRMVTDVEIRRLAVPDKLFAYAGSYLRGATTLCIDLAQPDAACTWGDGALVLMLSAHAVELFLKGLLLKRMPEEQVWKLGHNIERLTTEYCARFTDSGYEWDVPFKTEYTDRTTAQELVLRDAPPSILFRYPVTKSGKDWHGLYAFEPNSFIPILRRMSEDFKRLRERAA